MKVFDLNVVRRLKLPMEAKHLILQYLQEAHPTATFIKSVNFSHRGNSLWVRGAHMRPYRKVAVWNHPPLLHGLRVRHVSLRKDPDDDDERVRFQFDPKTGERSASGTRFPDNFILVEWPWGDANWLASETVWCMARDPVRSIQIIVQAQRSHYENEMWDWNLEHVC